MDRGELDRRERGALLASTAALVAVVVLQAPGRIVPETKLDLVIDPTGFLERALHAWDPSAGFGRLQNQAVGYLFPMGPVHAIGRALGLAPWLVQRLWIALVLALGLWGAHRVARAIGIGTAGGRLVAAWAYALAPATIGVAAFQSAGQLPYALAPHVLVPLLTAGPGASPRRVAARSTLWIAAMGGVNGASAFAVLPLVAIWFATRLPGPDRRRLFAWWSGGAVAATLWWFVPLVITVRYGVRFTDYTEQAGLTTATASATEVLRGTDNWLGYLQSPRGPWLPGAWQLAVGRVAVAGSVAAAAAGLVGLCRRDLPERTWLVTSAALGAVAIGAGYAGPWSGIGSGLVRDLLDGPLVAFRNVHKFAAVLRLPLALALGHLVVVASRSLPRRIPAPVPVAAALVAVVLAVAPALPQLTAPGSFDDLPDHWRDAAAWLDDADSSGALVLPGSAFGEYRWGRPLDEPLSALGTGRWATRDLIPLGGNGSTRLLDGIDEALARGVAPPSLVPVLQRMGISHLVVRNDLDLRRTGGPRPATVRRVLRQAPGLELVASFGAPGRDRGFDGRLASPAGAAGSEAYRDLDIWSVPPPASALTTFEGDGTLALTGGPEALLWLPPELLEGRAVVLDVDGAASLGLDAVVVATDTARRRDVNFGAIRDNATWTLTEEERSPATGRAPLDRWPAEEPRGLAMAATEGVATVHDGGQPTGIQPPELQPFAVFDGDPTTVWSAGGGEEGAWLEVVLDAPQVVAELRATLPRSTGRRVGSVEVDTDGGTVEATFDRGGVLVVALPEMPTERIRIEVTDVVGTAELGPVGIAEIGLDGVAIARPLVLADAEAGTDGAADVVNLVRARQDPMTATRTAEDGRLDRRFRWAGGDAELRGTAIASPGPALDALLAQIGGAADDRAIRADASSVFRRQPAFGPTAVLDGDPLTAWVSDREAGAPSLAFTWDGEVLVDTIRVEILEVPGAAVDRVEEVEVTLGGERHRRTLGLDGTVTLPTTFTDHVEVAFPADADTEPAAGRRVAVAEVEVPALLGRAPARVDGGAPPARTAVVELACGDGPRVAIGGRPIPTRATTTVGDLLDAAPVPWEACEPLSLANGEQRFEAELGAALSVDSTLLAPIDGIEPAQPARTLRDVRWSDRDRRATVGTGSTAILATTENRNDGWVATLDGRALEPIRVDGWRQGWVVPAGEGGELTLRYSPDRVHRSGLALGALLVFGLAAAAVVRPRPRGWVPPPPRSAGVGARASLVAIVAFALVHPVAVIGPGIVLALVVRRSRWGRWGRGSRRSPGGDPAARMSTTLAMLAAAAAAAAGMLVLIAPLGGLGGAGGTFSGPAQLLAATAFAVTAASHALSAGAGSTPSIRDRSDHPPCGSDTTLEGTG
jgi:arabinofuranan 3-O-arabinosyltransferase